MVKPTRTDERTASGLYLPPGMQEKVARRQGKVQQGYVMPMPVEDEEVRYVPLQAKEGDFAIFLMSGATEVMYGSEKYFIVPQSVLQMLE